MSTPARYLVWWRWQGVLDGSQSVEEQTRWQMRRFPTWEEALHEWQGLTRQEGYEVLITEHCPVVVRYEDGRKAIDPGLLAEVRRVKEQQERSNKFERSTSPPPPWSGAIPVDRGHLVSSQLNALACCQDCGCPYSEHISQPSGNRYSLMTYCPTDAKG